MTVTIPGPYPATWEKQVIRAGRLYRYPNPQAARYQAQVRACWRASGAPLWPEDQPLALSITVYHTIPPSAAPGTRRQMARGLHLPARRPDAGETATLFTQALTGLAFANPDQLARVEVVKCFSPGPPRAEVSLTPFSPQGAGRGGRP